MTLTLAPDIETLVTETARERGKTPGEFIDHFLRENLMPKPRQPINGITPRDDWEERILKLGAPSGVSLSNEAVSSEGIYD